MTQMEKPPANQPYMLEIDEDRAGQRIDNFLLTHLKGVPKSRIYRILRKGEVRVNKGRIKASYRLQEGDSVRIPPVRVAEPGAPVDPGLGVLEAIDQGILYEDKTILVLNKPSGIAVHGGSGISYGVIEALRVLRPDAHYLELVHRLDRDTSGCLLIAKKRSTLRYLHEMLREGKGIDKHYLALVGGPWQGGTKTVDQPLQKNVMQSGERIVRVHPDGKHALSIFTPIERYKSATLVNVDIRTGRTHQIRVHAAHAGHHIAGDTKYGDESFNKQMREKGLKRLFLHARSLSFPVMNSDQHISVTAPLEDRLEKLLKDLSSV